MWRLINSSLMMKLKLSKETKIMKQKIYNKADIKPEWEDYIWKHREFIQNLQRVADQEYENMKEKLLSEGMSDDMEEWLFDFTFNDGREDYFGEYLFDHGVLNIDEETYTYSEWQYDADGNYCGEIIKQITSKQIIEYHWDAYAKRCGVLRMESTEAGCVASWCNAFEGIKI